MYSVVDQSEESNTVVSFTTLSNWFSAHLANKQNYFYALVSMAQDYLVFRKMFEISENLISSQEFLKFSENSVKFSSSTQMILFMRTRFRMEPKSFLQFSLKFFFRFPRISLVHLSNISFDISLNICHALISQIHLKFLLYLSNFLNDFFFLSKKVVSQSCKCKRKTGGLREKKISFGKVWISRRTSCVRKRFFYFWRRKNHAQNENTFWCN